MDTSDRSWAWITLLGHWQPIRGQSGWGAPLVSGRGVDYWGQELQWVSRSYKKSPVGNITYAREGCHKDVSLKSTYIPESQLFNLQTKNISDPLFCATLLPQMQPRRNRRKKRNRSTKVWRGRAPPFPGRQVMLWAGENLSTRWMEDWVFELKLITIFYANNVSLLPMFANWVLSLLGALPRPMRHPHKLCLTNHLPHVAVEKS